MVIYGRWRGTPSGSRRIDWRPSLAAPLDPRGESRERWAFRRSSEGERDDGTDEQSNAGRGYMATPVRAFA